MVKKHIHIFILFNIICYFVLQLFSPLFFTIKSYQLKQEQQRLAHSKNIMNPQVIDFTAKEFAEYALDENKEIFWKNKYYEIISVKHHNGKLSISVIADEEETEWLNFSGEQINKCLKNCNAFLSLLIYNTSFDSNPIPEVHENYTEKTYIDLVENFNSSPALNITSPPPDI